MSGASGSSVGGVLLKQVVGPCPIFFMKKWMSHLAARRR